MASEDPSLDMFAGMKKKKSSKKAKDLALLDEQLAAAQAPATKADQEAPVQQASEPTDSSLPVEQVADDLNFSDLKKKKKKKAVRIEGIDPAEEAVATGEGVKTDALGNTVADDAALEHKPVEADMIHGQGELADAQATDVTDDFADIKKKKKKGKKSTFDLDAFEREIREAEGSGANNIEGTAQSDDEMAGGGDDEAPAGDDPFNEGGGADGADASGGSKAIAAAQAQAWLKDGNTRDYHYTELLGRFYQMLYASHPSLSGGDQRKRYVIAPPKIFREGSKRTVFANVLEICKKMHRQPEHVIQFMLAELGTSGSVGGEGQVTIKGRFQQKQIENVLRRYIGPSLLSLCGVARLTHLPPQSST